MVLFFVGFSISRAGFNSVARKPLRSVPGSIPARELCFESHSTLFQASWLSFEAFTSLMRIGFLYDNCLGFDLTFDYTDIILSNVAAVVYNEVAFTWSLCSSCTEEEC